MEILEAWKLWERQNLGDTSYSFNYGYIMKIQDRHFYGNHPYSIQRR